MIFAQAIFDGFEDLTGTFSVADITMAMVLSFVLCAIVGLTYRMTHRGISYSQSYVQTLVLMGMVVSLVMLIVGSNIARAFALVGALSIIRFRNAIKETRDVGFIFHPDLCVLEVKVNERVPYWLTELIARTNLQLVRMSKYCQSVEAFGVAPRSAHHLPDDA